MEHILKVDNLTKHYQDFSLDVSFDIPKGTIMGLIGENGAGKSTTIKAILDLIKRDSGTVTFWGRELGLEPKLLKEDIGVVFDGLNFHDTLTLEAIQNICKNVYSKWDSAVFENFVKRFNLPRKKEIKSFSRGMKVKLGISIALSHHPKILILDEATSGLDPIMREEILDIFLDFVQDENRSILVSSHITSDLEKIADYITFIHDGKVLFSKPKDELIYNYGIIRCGKEVFNKIDSEDILAFYKRDYQWEVLVQDRQKASAKYQNAIIDRATIDEIMFLVLKGEK